MFIGGATGAIGRSLRALPQAKDAPLVLHFRPRRADEAKDDPRARVFELDDEKALDEALEGCTTVVQLIGTMRKRFSTGDTYETSDIGTTRLLVEGAKRADVDHVVLLSSVGAGQPVGAYLKAKAEAERIVTSSGLDYTIFRPSAFVGEGHRPPPGFGTVTRALGLKRYQPVAVSDLAAGILHVALSRAPLGAVLEGASLLRLLDAGSA